MMSFIAVTVTAIISFLISSSFFVFGANPGIDSLPSPSAPPAATTEKPSMHPSTTSTTDKLLGSLSPKTPPIIEQKKDAKDGGTSYLQSQRMGIQKQLHKFLKIQTRKQTTAIEVLLKVS